MNLVQFTGTIQGLRSPGNIFPGGSFPYFLHSSWHCLPGAGVGLGCDMVFSNLSFFEVDVFNRNIPPSFPYCEVKLSSNFNAPFADIVFTLPANELWHILVSVNCLTNTIQVYCNDQPCPINGGGFSSSGQMGQTPYAGSGGSVLDVGSAGNGYPAVGDLWEMIPTSFIDLSVAANRRKFINSNLTPVNLGSNGQNPFGSAPPLFLTAPSAPTDIATNYGSGGSFTINLAGGPATLDFQAPGLCPVPSPPIGPPPVLPPPPPPPGPATYLREHTYRARFLGKSFDPTVVITKDRPGPLRIVEIDAWMN